MINDKYKLFLRKTQLSGNKCIVVTRVPPICFSSLFINNIYIIVSFNNIYLIVCLLIIFLFRNHDRKNDY